MFSFKYLFDSIQEFSVLIAGKNFLLLTQSDMVASKDLKILLYSVFTYAWLNCLEYFIKSESFQRFVVRKLVDTELKLSEIKQSIRHVNDNLNRISDRLGFVGQAEEKENIDIFQDLPLKDVNELEALEIKLKNDLLYRNKMIN